MTTWPGLVGSDIHRKKRRNCPIAAKRYSIGNLRIVKTIIWARLGISIVISIFLSICEYRYLYLYPFVPSLMLSSAPSLPYLPSFVSWNLPEERTSRLERRIQSHDSCEMIKYTWEHEQLFCIFYHQTSSKPPDTVMLKVRMCSSEPTMERWTASTTPKVSCDSLFIEGHLWNRRKFILLLLY